MSDPRPVKTVGLTQIYSPRANPTVDIVFVHGLSGHPRNSWTSQTGCFWPADLLPQALASVHPRVLTYGYNATVPSVAAARHPLLIQAETLLSDLVADRKFRNCSERPIIFVSHSLGGLIVKYALISSDEKTNHLRSVYISTFGILFFGTPHNGPDIADWGSLLQGIYYAINPTESRENSSLLMKLRYESTNLESINTRFLDIISRFRIYFLYELRPTELKHATPLETASESWLAQYPAWPATEMIIVDEASAAPPILGVDRMGIEADHVHICKFSDQNAPGFETIAKSLLKYSREAPFIIADRWWNEEGKKNAYEGPGGPREDDAGKPALYRSIHCPHTTHLVLEYGISTVEQSNIELVARI
ncbi:uncharacterized protein N7482_008189 [Penicillium canariense]|uniref:AB hydrolase-1 domain-containing protein n=1 Tax=Penicillium canariense TaxID=189055 RepID=A0A9W9HVA1_9EURO|nr:uncharacterized protein N7482_008189 [Penicillium canariense]KAJ5157089.1 hypothetical protein N7482_008189 [Penicillium canariense]